MLYHGTTHEFTKFNLSRGNLMNHIGTGVYLTDSLEDCNRHYTDASGPDLKHRIETLADEMMNVDDDELSNDDAMANAKAALVGPVRRILTCTIKPEAKLLTLGNHYVEMYDYGNNPDDEIEATRFGGNLQSVLEGYGIDSSSFFNDDSMKTADILKELTNLCCDNDIWSGEVFREIVLAAGFDGIEYEDVRDWFKMVERGTKHFVLYKPELVSIISTEELDT